MSPSKEEVQKFSMMIDKMSSELNIPIIDTLTHHCETSGLEIEVASTLISNALKGKILEEAQDNNLIKRTSRLPV
jgi:hypothetical protein